MSSIIVTGAAGFIGYHVCRMLAERGDKVVGIDNFTPYYPVEVKRDRIRQLERYGRLFELIEVDFADAHALEASLEGRDIGSIIHLGAQAGVRYSLTNPTSYAHSNIVGHLNMLEVARHREVGHFVYASSSSVYGGNKSLPFRVEDRVDHPLSLYAATKKADELMSETYSQLYRIPQTGLRFFTVYGPWGRPDMAVWLFTQSILAGKPIEVFGDGDMRRDFTYIDDVVSGILAALNHPPKDNGLPKSGGSEAPHSIYNIGNNKSEELADLIAVIEDACGRKAIRYLQPMQPGDARDTYADISAIQADLGFRPTTSIQEGVPRFVAWYRDYVSA